MCPGAFNALVARAVAKAGFQACYISGGATANISGYPDIGLITLSEMCRTIREIADASKLPVIDRRSLRLKVSMARIRPFHGRCRCRNL